MSFDLESLRRRLRGRAGPDYWRALEEASATPQARAFLKAQFPSQEARFELQRRDFLRLMGASLALAGLGGCTRQPPERIYPFSAQPEARIPGKPLFFATAMPLGDAALGLLVESHEGRPTKVEGNPLHPSSLGATDLYAQASVLSLYDPDRSSALLRNGEISTWDLFLDDMRPRMEELAKRGGEGLALLTEPVLSPTLRAQIGALLAKFPKARWHAWTPLHRDAARRGAELAFGRDVVPVHRFDRARVVLSLDDDFLGAGPGWVRYARDFAAARRGRKGSEALNRLYAVETTPTLTGAMADHRLAMPSAGVEGVARAVARGLGIEVDGPRTPPTAFAQAVAKDLKAHAGACLVVAGRGQSPEVHALAHALNAALGNGGRTVDWIEPPAAAPGPSAESVSLLATAMREGRVGTLVMLGGNPVWTAPADVGFAAALQKVPFRVHLSAGVDETSELCHWHVPEAHFLESWSDARGHDGTVSIVQPLIAPLFGGRTAHEILGVLLDRPTATPHDLVKEHWSKGREEGFDRFWKTALHDGVVPGTASSPAAVTPAPLKLGPAPEPPELEIAFRPDASVLDGRFANNGWLQETPRPLTRLAWDNAALMAPADAKARGLANGDLVALEALGRTVEAPVWVTPGHARGVVTVHLGAGRLRAGPVGNGVGFNAYALRAAAAPWSAQITLRKLGRRRSLVSVQDHARMEGRDLVKTTTLGKVRAGERPHAHGPADPDSLSLYPEWPYEGYAWGLTIDLNACTGCNACMVACQAENNVPVVGRDQVALGREMHWIRIDRYYEGPDDDPEALHQPVPCMHCERAPCEPVCPVAATVHGEEGLNEMVYNRCVGTRYCANNCPYKVRRFNFYLYTDYETELKKLGANPDVTIRSRGVMEKCTYCVQRINEARIDAKREDRTIRDGEVQTACMQVCPTRAIVFGDLNDKESEVAGLRDEPHHYALLAELGTKPRTTYLAKLRNPNPELEGL